ncbi:hypothetical protein QFC22_001978 [Naganishia vaughanmartiniae]|uniref:Uncharacterized protein n=1 Tax=Naganishia vaughanmartiniae TaxID=1424756 RepID=A0ACC2XGM9_9TREE|nr:hypothetical protein QFC22_001978 [Naganishia vaughanmartiniae]
MDQSTQEHPVPDVEAEIQSLLAQIAIESRIQYGAQKFLESLSQDDSFVPEQERDGLRRKVESELAATEGKIEAFKRKIRELQASLQTSSEVTLAESTDRHAATALDVPRHQPITYTASSSTLASTFSASSPSRVPDVLTVPQRHNGPLRPRTYSSATTNTTASHDRLMYTEPDQMSIISSSEGGAYPPNRPPGYVLTTSPRSQMRQSRQNRSLLRRVENQSRSQSRQGSIRADVRSQLPAQQFSVTSVDYSLEHMDALSRLANAVAATGLSNRDSFSLDRSGPFDLYSPALGKNGELDALLDNINELAAQEEQRRAEVVEALGVARRVLKGLESQQNTPLTSGIPSRYGLSQRRPTEERNEEDMENDDTPNAAKRYASFMRSEALGQSSSSENGGSRDQGMKGSPAKMIALLTRCLKTCPDILSELEFENLVDASLARQPQNRQNEEAEQAILLIRTAMYLPIPVPSYASEETHDMADLSLELHSEAGVQENDVLSEMDAPMGERKEDCQEDNGRTASDERPSVVAQGLIRALVGMAENPEDGLQRICLETLAELAILDLHAVTEADAFRVLLQAIEQGPYDTSRAITNVLIHVLDSPLSRNALPVHTGIEVLLSGFTDAYGKGAAYLERLTSTAENVLTMLRSWSGLMYCYTYKERGVAALVEALKIPVTEMRTTVTNPVDITQVLPRLFEMAAAYDDPAERTAALTALASINSFHRARRKLEPEVKTPQGRKRYVRLSAPVLRFQILIECSLSLAPIPL